MCDFFRRQQAEIDQVAVIGHQRQRLKGKEAVVAGYDQFDILDPHPALALAVDTGLIAEQHAGLQRRLTRLLADALWAFVHAEIGADAVAGAVLEVHALGPHELPGQHVKMMTHGAGREGLPRQRQMPLEGQAVIPALPVGRLPADRPDPGDVGGAVVVLPAAVDQQHLALVQGQRVFADRIVRDGRMTGEGRDGVEADPVHRHGVRVLLAEGQQGRRNRQLAFLLDRRMLGQPAGKADHGAGVAALGIAGTLLLGLVLDGPRQHNRVRVGNDLDACIAQGLGDGGVARGPVKTDAPAVPQPGVHFFGRKIATRLSSA